MRCAPESRPGLCSERGQATVLLLGVAAVVIAGTLILAAMGQALGAKGRHQRAADLAAVSAARAMSEAYPRLFEPAYLRPGTPNPRHLDRAEYLDVAQRAGTRAAAANGVAPSATEVSFPGRSFAPTRVAVRVRGNPSVRIAAGDDRGAVRTVPVAARAVAELAPDEGAGAFPGQASGGGYTGPLAYRQGKPMRPDVATAFDRLATAAREAGLVVTITSGFRSDAEQARLFAARPDPRWVAPPGKSLHRLGTELDLGPPAAYGWLARNAGRFGFLKRYSWEPWHFEASKRSSGLGHVGAGRQRPARGSECEDRLPNGKGLRVG